MTDDQRYELLGHLHKQERQPAPEAIEVLRIGGKDLNYLSHAETTNVLLEHDPLWSWEPLDKDTLELLGVKSAIQARDGVPVGLWIRLTIHGHSRIGFGSCLSTAGDPIKELIGDAIRNAAMRFGVALNLWSEAERVGLERDAQ